MKNLLINGFKELGILYNNETYEKFSLYKDILLEWNEKFNLTTITEEEDIAVKHFLDSMTIWSGVKNRKNLADIGSGAGFPGIPLKIAGYEGETVLFDSLKKRVDFLKAVIEKLKLKNCTAVHIRAEDAGRSKYREYFDAVTARAVADLPVLCEYCIPLIKTGGVFIAMKGPNGKKEAERAVVAIKKLGGKITGTEEMNLPGSNMKRNIIYISKIKNTPLIYPRKAGTPNKKPLL